MSEWNEKGATFSDKSARKEFDLTQDEIIEAVKTGKQTKSYSWKSLLEIASKRSRDFGERKIW